MSKQALEFSPNEPSYLDTYGWILYQMGKYEEAIVYLKKAVELSKDSNDSVLWEHLGDAYYKSGNVDEALKNWKIAMEKGDTNEKLFQKIQDKKINE
jgi:tetratricopeptide (TPR) repeat protein